LSEVKKPEGAVKTFVVMLSVEFHKVGDPHMEIVYTLPTHMAIRANFPAQIGVLNNAGHTEQPAGEPPAVNGG